MLKLSKRWAQQLVAEPETGMGYHVVSVVLHDGRRYDRVVIDSGYVTAIKDIPTIPFDEGDIAEVLVTHDKCPSKSVKGSTWQLERLTAAASLECHTVVC